MTLIRNSGVLSALDEHSRLQDAHIAVQTGLKGSRDLIKILAKGITERPPAARMIKGDQSSRDILLKRTAEEPPTAPRNSTVSVSIHIQRKGGGRMKVIWNISYDTRIEIKTSCSKFWNPPSLW